MRTRTRISRVLLAVLMAVLLLMLVAAALVFAQGPPLTMEFNLNDGEGQFGSHITSTAGHVSTILVVYPTEDIPTATVTLEGYDISMNPVFTTGPGLSGTLQILGSTLIWQGGFRLPGSASEFIITFENSDYGECHEFSARVDVGDEWETKEAELCNTIQPPPDVNVWATDGTNSTHPGESPLITDQPFAVGTDIWAQTQNQTATVIFAGLEPAMEADFWFSGDDAQECEFGGDRCTWIGTLADPISPTVMGVALQNTFYLMTRTFTVTVLTEGIEQNQSVTVVNNTEPPPPPPPEVSIEFVAIDDLDPDNNGQIITTTNRFVLVGVLYLESVISEPITIEIGSFTEELSPTLELGDGLDPNALVFENGIYTYTGILNLPFRPNEFIIRTAKGVSPGVHEFTFTAYTANALLSKTVTVINPWRLTYLPMLEKP